MKVKIVIVQEVGHEGKDTQGAGHEGKDSPGSKS